jgi:hypothetical protein
VSTTNQASYLVDGTHGSSPAWHVGRRWNDHTIEDTCPCPKGPCGLAAYPFDPACEHHPWGRSKTMRQMHHADDCPGEYAR